MLNRKPHLVAIPQAVLLACFTLFSLALCVRCFAGHEVGRPVSIRSPLNVESFVSLSFLLLILLRSQPSGSLLPGPNLKQWQALSVFCALSAICIFCFGPSLSTPFLFDDYGHLAIASRANWQTISDLFLRRFAEKGFRPFGFLTYYLDFHWAYFNPFLWHCWNLGVHIINCFLVFLLARKLRFSAFASFVAGALFAVHGSHAEPVCWTDARFDLLATFFVLTALLCFLQYATRESGGWLATGLLCSVLALASKESSFSLPFLMLTLLLFFSGKERRKLAHTIPTLIAVCCLVFAYRWWLIGGIGGYETNGHADVLNLSLVRSVKALFWRTWALLFFPINWASGTGVWLSMGSVAFLLALATALVKTRIGTRTMLASLTFTLTACLPVQHLLLLGSDAAGSRLLYLPSVGLGLLWAAIVEANRGKPVTQILVAAGLMFFNVTALEHNIYTWREVAQQAQQVCRSFGREIANEPGTVVVTGVPSMYRGVYFLSHGFADCVAQNSGVPASKIQVAGEGTSVPPQTPQFRWNESAIGFQRTPAP